MCLWEEVCRFTWTGCMNTSASAVSGKQRDPTSQGYCTAARLFSDDHTSFTASDRTHTSVYRTVSDPHGSRVCKRESVWERWDLQSLHTRRIAPTLTQRLGLSEYSRKHSQRASNSQSRRRLGRFCYPMPYFLKMNLLEPPEENSTLPRMSRNVNRRCLSPRSDTDGCDGKAQRSHTEAG